MKATSQCKNKYLVTHIWKSEVVRVTKYNMEIKLHYRFVIPVHQNNFEEEGGSGEDEEDMCLG